MRTGLGALVLNKQQFTNLRERKPELLGFVDELEVLDILRRIQSEAAFAALGLAEQAFLLVEPDGVYAQTRCASHFPNLKAARHAKKTFSSGSLIFSSGSLIKDRPRSLLQSQVALTEALESFHQLWIRCFVQNRYSGTKKCL
jgi:hypothetical protein